MFVVIEICGLCKYYGQVRAVDQLDLKVGPGEIFGLLGPNGAGKTTTVRILTTLSRPTAGKAFINRREVTRHSVQVKKEFGLVPQQLNVDMELTAWENMELHGMLHGSPDGKGMPGSGNCSLLWTEDHAGTLVEHFSGGMKRRLMIARALMQRPRILFLDEPTVGLDPQVRRRIWDLIRRLNGQGITVLLTTHYIEEAEVLCSRVGILNRGRLIALGTPEELREGVGRVVVEAAGQYETEYHVFERREQALQYAAGLTGGAATLIRDSSLEDVFVELTGGKVVG